MTKAPNYPKCTYKNLLQRYFSRFRVEDSGFRVYLTNFHMCSLCLSKCWIQSVPFPNALSLVYLTISFCRWCSRCPHNIKTENNKSQRPEGTLSKIVHSCLVFMYRWEDQCLKLKTSSFKPCHILCQLGLELDNVNGVNVVCLERTFRLT